MNIIDLFKKEKSVKDFLSCALDNKYTFLVNNLSLNHEYLLTYLLYLEKNETIVYVASNLYKANTAYESLSLLAGMNNVSLYLADELVSSELLAVSSDFLYERINTLREVTNGEKRIIITHPQAVLKPIVSKARYLNSLVNLKVSDEINTKDLIKKLIALGYKRSPSTETMGDFSIRGEIIDIFPAFSSNAVRINLFDTEIETLKYFDITTQKSIKKIENVQIYPLNEIIYNDEDIMNIEEEISKNIKELPNFVIKDLEDFRDHNNVDRLSKYIKYFSKDYTNFLDYLENPIVIYQDYQRLHENYEMLINDLSNYLESLNKPHNLNLFFFFDFNNLFYKIDRQIFVSEYKKSLNDIRLDKVFSFNGYAVIDYQNDIKNMIIDLKANPTRTYIFAISTDERYNLINEVLSESGLNIFECSDLEKVKKSSINLIKSDNAISFGFYNSFEVITENEVYKQFKAKKAKYRSMMKDAKPISSKDDLKIGDYVVHYDYGVGRYLGIKTVDLKEVRNDYIRIEYANMELLIPVEKIILLEKYQGSEGVVPRITHIGKGEWDKKKQKIREKLESIALDLINMQATREENLGYKYPEDGEFQRLFEEDFEYDETIDQLKAINEIKKDMEEGRIVDRLICGDVGYGKTEIAMRIAFKTVFSNKQVAYLAPTTILTRQHFYTFKERFEKYGIRVELLNRMVSKKKQAEILDDLKAGLVDIIIGTHRLLSSDIKFLNLGLLIVDEEQRFGVVHKEKIKKLKNNINVLTLTATPIPRTLQMSIMGVRQLSLIETPPKDRYPIQTYVVEANDIVIKEAIYRELSRGGQVFYLHNRVMGLDRLEKHIKKLVPEANIAIAHGQMQKNQLEDTIQSFIDNEFNVLLCTTIIETGIDIPNTNTLIIDGAEFLGLSQIYQIRGRVGRTTKVAYAYLMYEEDKVLTDDASKRLNAIKEFTSLGSGYKIAVRDLAIRGAGDILGKEQSGFIDAIGLDMYMKMLNEAINKVKGNNPEIEEKNYLIDISKHVDESYVSDDDIKILIHKEIYKVKTKEEKINIINEFTDRFGKLNDEILTYIEERYLQTLLKQYEVASILETQVQVMVAVSKKISQLVSAEKLFLKANEIDMNIKFEYKNEQIIIRIPKIAKDKTWIFKLSGLLEVGL